MSRGSESVFVAGSTGYVGSRFVADLLSRGHSVRALARPGSEGKLPAGCTIVRGDPLSATTFETLIAPATTWVHLVGVPHPSPSKAGQFKAIDLKSVEEAVPAALQHAVKHFVYVSVAHPAPVMKAYIEVRARCEELILNSGLRTTILRPWYVLGPGHLWPYTLKPIYALLERIPATADGARRLGLVHIRDMVNALVDTVENPPQQQRIVEVPEIRAVSRRVKTRSPR